MQTNKLDTGFLDGTRFLLALWVTIGHFYKYVGGAHLIDLPVIGSILLANGSAVDGFMIITGFLMMYNYLQRETKEPPRSFRTFRTFWLRRLFRLYPVYLLAIVAAFLLYPAVPGAQATHQVAPQFAVNGLSALLPHLTFVHGLIPQVNSQLLGPAWSLSLEMQFYLLFPVIFLLFFYGPGAARTRIWVLTILSTALGVLAPMFMGVWDEPGRLMSFGAPSLLIYKLHFFALGMITAGVALKRWGWGNLAFWLIVALPFQRSLTSLVVVGVLALLFSEQYRRFLPQFAGAFIAWIKRLLSTRFSTFGADISYSLYLTHLLLIPVVVALVADYAGASGISEVMAAVISLVLFLIVNTALSYVLFIGVEKPFITIGKKFITRLNSNPKTAPASGDRGVVPPPA